MTTHFPSDMILHMKNHLRMGWQRNSLIPMFGPNAAHHMGLKVNTGLLTAAGYREAAKSGNWDLADEIRDNVEMDLYAQATDALIAAVGPVQVLTLEERQAAEEERYAHCHGMEALRFEEAAYGRD